MVFHTSDNGMKVSNRANNGGGDDTATAAAGDPKIGCFVVVVFI
jgi:hypothetical protein